MALVSWCVAFVLGDACALTELMGARAATVWIAAGVLAWGLAWRLRRGLVVVAALPIGFGVGAWLGARALVPAAIDPALARALDADTPVIVEAEVARGPEMTGAGTRLVVRVHEVDGRAGAGTVALGVIRGWPDFGPGEIVRFRAKLRSLHGTRNPGLPDPMLGLRAAGIEALAAVGDAGAIERLAEPAGTGPRRLAFVARRALRAAVDRAVPGPPGAFLRTAVLGDRRGVSEEIEAGFRAAGATHVLSVSGLHLAAVAGVLFLLARAGAVRVPGLALRVDPRAVAGAVALPGIAFFTLLTGEAIATERSALMLSVAMGAFVVGRSASPGPTIAVAALVLLARQPLALLDVSLQLSLTSVTGMALLARRLLPRPSPDRSTPARLLSWLWRFAAATAAATAATAPLVAHHFGEVAPMALLGNLALVPLVELALVPVGLAGAIAGAVWAPLGHPLLFAAGWTARAALAIAAGFRSYAPLVCCRAPNRLETAALVAAGCLALAALAARDRGRRLAAIAAAVALAVAVASLATREIRRRYTSDLVVTFLDVGQGDAAVVEAPGGQVMLVDGGGARDGNFDPGARIVEPFLRARGIARVDVVALSHPHPDHLNGLHRVLERFDVGALWSSGDDGRNPEYRRLLDTARRRAIATPVVAPRALGSARIEPLGPFYGDDVGKPPGLTVNDASLVLRLGWAGRGVLFTGDLEADGEGELAGRRDTGQTVAADVLKVPHHGSRTSSSDELIDAVAPRLAVISLGWRNQFRFPAAEVVARYHARGIRLLRTDRDGAVTVRISPAGAIDVRCERGCADAQPAAAGDR